MSLCAAAWSSVPAPAAAQIPTPDDPLPLAVASTRVTAHPSLGSPAELSARTLSLHGLPVRGAFETVRDLGRGDGPVVVAARRPMRAPQLRPDQVRVAAAALPQRIADALGLPAPVTPATAPELVYLMLLGEPVLAWEVTLPMTRDPEPDRRTVWISAGSGRLLQERQHVFASRARIFPENPGKTPDPVDVELVDLAADGPGVRLEGTRLRSLNCVDDEPAEIEPWWDEGECYAQATVLSDDAGDFFTPLPDVVVFGQNIQAADGYAELSMFAHADRFLAHLATLGVPDFACEKSTLVANFRDLEPDGNLPYDALNNAYYTGECDPAEGPTMIFGQGSEVDFGYDGDVVYHEMGHGVVAHLAPEGLGNRAKRADGFVLDARALNECFADYLSLSLTGDPELAEYVGRFWAANSRPYIRSAENDRVCPANIANQEHNDSEPITAALWATRRQADDPRGVDRLVLETIARVAPDETLDGAANIMLDVGMTLVDEGTITPHTYDVLVRSLESRGLVDCARVITDPESVRSGRRMSLLRVNESVAPFWPSSMQLRYEVPAGAGDIVVRMSLRASEPTDPIDAHVLVKYGDEPITFTYDLVASDDPPADPDAADDEEPIRDLTLVGGDWDLELSPQRLSEGEFELDLGGRQPGEVLHLTVVNVAPANVSVGDFRVLSRTDFDPVAPDEPDDETDPDDAPEEVGGDAVISACTCRADAPLRSNGWALMLLLPLGARRRR